MYVDFIKVSPSQNTTVMITSYCPSSDYTKLAEKIMSYEYLQAEQVGFIVPPKNSCSKIGLDMAGGEFCGNAALSAAAYVWEKGITHFVLNKTLCPDDYKKVIEQIKNNCTTESIGVISYEKIRGTIYKIKPYVYVEKIDLGLFERSCGSGSFALGIHLAKNEGITGRTVVNQPGGSIIIEIGDENFISTEVKFTCEGRAIL